MLIRQDARKKNYIPPRSIVIFLLFVVYVFFFKKKKKKYFGIIDLYITLVSIKLKSCDFSFRFIGVMNC